MTRKWFRKLANTHCSILCLIALFFSFSLNASAVDYQNATDIQFTFEPTVTVSIADGSLTIDNLSSGQSVDSNVLSVAVGSNGTSGYTIYANVGDSSHNYTDLRLTSSDSVHVFKAANAINLESIEGGRWGYSYSVDNGEHWGYGNIGESTATAGGYGALPLFNGSSHAGDVVLADVNNSGSSVVKFKIGAKAADDQMAGTYSNVINFIGVTKVNTTSYTLKYNTNATGVTNMPTTPVNGTVSSTKPLVTLEDKIPVRSGYTFKGWCDTSTSGATCSGTTTQPGRIYKINTSNASATVNMYAMWQANS